MSIAQEIFTRVDLSTGLTIATQRAALMQGDKNANRMTAAVFDGKNEVTLSGMTASGQFIRPDGVTIPLEGRTEGNKVSVTFNPSCYAVDGNYRAMLFLSVGEESRTIMEISGQIHDRGGDKILDVENIVPSVSDIVTQYATMKTVTQETQTAGSNAAQAASAANTAAKAASDAEKKITGMTASATKGEDASVTVIEKDGVKHFDFVLPKGDKGERGEKGETGSVENLKINGVSVDSAGNINVTKLVRSDDNAFAHINKSDPNRTHGLHIADPDTGVAISLYGDMTSGIPYVRYQDENGNVKQHGLYSTLNKPTAGDVGALAKTGGTASGLIKATNFVVGNATDYPSIGFQGLDVSKGQLGAIQFSGPNNGRRFSFVQYPSDQDGATTRYLESYQLPKPSAGLTKTEYYDFLTTKTPVTIAQGGTGKTTAAEALAALSGVPTGRTINGKALTGDVTLSPADIGGFVGCHEVSVTSESIAAGQTGTASVTFTAISGASKYYAVPCQNGTVWGYIAGVSISGTTLTATFYNNSTGAHTIGSKFLIIGVK